MKKQIVIGLVNRVNKLGEQIDELEGIFDSENFYRMTKSGACVQFEQVDLENYLFKTEVGKIDCALSTMEIISAIAYIMDIDEEKLSENNGDYNKFYNFGFTQDGEDYDYDRYYNDLIELSKLYPLR